MRVLELDREGVRGAHVGDVLLTGRVELDEFLPWVGKFALPAAMPGRLLLPPVNRPAPDTLIGAEF